MKDIKRDFSLRQRASTVRTEADLVDSLNYILRTYLHYQSVSISLSDLREFSNLNNDSRYDIFSIPKKKKGETRTISAPKDKLKIILKAINVLLSNCYFPPRFVTGFVYSTSVVDNAHFHVGRKYVLNIDLKDFFDSIPYDLVISKLMLPPFSFSKVVATTIANLSFLRSSKFDRLVLAQGSPISPVLSNIYCESLDNDLYALSVQYGVSYSRYADDISFSADENVIAPGSPFFNAVLWSINANGLSLNADKVRLQNHHHRQSVTGLIVNVKVNVSRKYIKDIRNLLYIWKRYGSKSAYRCFASYYSKHYPRVGNKTIPNFIDYLRGKINYLGLVKGKDNPLFVQYKSLFDSLVISKGIEPFRGDSYRSVARFEKKRQKLNLTIAAPRTNKFGKLYYAIDYPVPGGEILISPKIYEFVQINSPSIPAILRKDCSVHKIYSRDGVKWILSENSNADIQSDVSAALNAEREARIKELEKKSAQNDEGFVRSEKRLTEDEELQFSYVTEGCHTFDSDYGFISLYKYYYCKTFEQAKLAMVTYFKEVCHVNANLSTISDESLMGGLHYGHNDDSRHECRIIRLK